MIVGNSISLQPISPQDTDFIIKWRNNPNVRKNLVSQITLTREMHQNWLETKVASGEVVQYIITDKGSDQPVGTIYFNNIDKTNRVAEFGIFIGEDSARGKGLGSEATKLFCEYGFHSLGLRRIFLRVFADNKQAIQCYINAGFVFDDLRHDMVCVEGEFREMFFMERVADL